MRGIILPLSIFITEVSDMKLGDIVIAAVILLIAAAIWVFPVSGGGRGGLSVTVSQNGHEIRRIGLTPAGERTEVSLDGAKAAVENGRVCMLDSTCPDKVCVKTGWISGAGQSIVCVPNRIIIKISGNNRPAADAVSG